MARNIDSYGCLPIVVSKRTIVTTIVEGDSDLTMYEAAFVAIAQQDEPGTFDFDVVFEFDGERRGQSFSVTVERTEVER